MFKGEQYLGFAPKQYGRKEVSGGYRWNTTSRELIITETE